MRLSFEQIERLATRVFRVLQQSGYLELDYSQDELVEEAIIDEISRVFEDDVKTDERLIREAERLVQQQIQIVKSSGKSFEQLVAEVRDRLAKSKNIPLGNSIEQADILAERVTAVLWKIDSVDFFGDTSKVRNCIAKAIYRFRLEDDRIVDAIEKLVSKKTEAEPYSAEWCTVFDKCYQDVSHKLGSTAHG